MKHVFIINPAAGKKDATTQVAAGIRAACLRRELEYDILTTEHPRHAVELVREKAAEYAGEQVRFYACGGDGTLNEVAAGALEQVHIRVHTAGCSWSHGTASHACRCLGRTCIVNRMILDVLWKVFTLVNTFFQLGMSDVTTHNDGTVQ